MAKEGGNNGALGIVLLKRNAKNEKKNDPGYLQGNWIKITGYLESLVNHKIVLLAAILHQNTRNNFKTPSSKTKRLLSAFTSFKPEKKESRIHNITAASKKT